MRRMTDGEPITPEGLEALKAELARLEGDARRDIARRIQAARELGDHLPLRPDDPPANLQVEPTMLDAARRAVELAA